MGQSGDRGLPDDVFILFHVPGGGRVLAVGHARSVGAAERRPVLRGGGNDRENQQSDCKNKSDPHFASSFFKTSSLPAFFQLKPVTLSSSTLNVMMTPPVCSTSKACSPTGLSALSNCRSMEQVNFPSLILTAISNCSPLKLPSYNFSFSGSTLYSTLGLGCAPAFLSISAISTRLLLSATVRKAVM